MLNVRISYRRAGIFDEWIIYYPVDHKGTGYDTGGIEEVPSNQGR
jgi:hypothetical protein